MKKVTTILAAILLMAVGATAQKLSYSAVVRNSANELVANENIMVAVSIANSNGGAEVYGETHSATTNANGLVTLTIGEGTGATGSLADVTWKTAFITTTYTLSSGTVTNTVPVNAVPYALYADNISADGLVSAIASLTDEQKAAVLAALGVSGGGGGSETFSCGVDKMIIGEGVDRQEYETVQIGTQCWTKTNLRTTKKADGGDIADGGSNTSETEPYYYDNSSSSIPLAERGYLYNWAAAMVACPTGWHLPSDAEWNTMEATVSGSEWQTSYETANGNYRGSHAGKLAGGDKWETSSTSGTPGDYGNADRNVSGFSAVPAGSCNGSSFYNAGNVAYFWNATQSASNTSRAYDRVLYYDNVGVFRNDGNTKNYGLSVRCLKDASGDEPGGGGGGGSETFTCGVDKMIIGEGADRQEYETVQIGTQCWTKTNLRTTKKADGGDIADGGSNYSYTEPYYYDYSSSGIPLADRGYLYNWAAANVVCPVGWHLPSDAEWTTMEQTQTTMDVSGSGWRGDHAGKLAGGSSWQSSSEANAPGNMSYSERNASGFGAVPAGDWLNGFYDAGNNAYFWSSTELGSVHAWGRYLNYNYADVKRLNDTKSFGFSVRCLKDASGDEPGGGGGGGSETFSCGVDKMIIGEGADRQEYETVQIGTQCWTKTNLRTTKKADGGDIADGGSNTSNTEPYYYDYSSSSIPLAERGYLYNWAAANVVCPVGWHLPSDAEWMALEQPLTTMDVSGTGWRGDHAGKLAGGTYWQPSSSSNAPGNTTYSGWGTSGFGAVPAGSCYGSSFYDAGTYASFWSSTQDASSPNDAYNRGLSVNTPGVGRYGYNKYYGYSVRCVRD